ncbi:major capsid protein [Endozoicomonas lisbonensis]|uniref:major capsid protein n=1 Tax=Endozoicomonas lisbonensis TaxID=3120522 RepID=UPI003396144F
MSLFTTRVLLGAIQRSFKFQPLFLQLFFPKLFTFDTEKVDLDLIDGEVSIAPFVSPVVSGQVMKSRGYNTNSFVPGYVKPKHEVNPQKLLRRRAGEKVGGEETPADRRKALIMQNLEDEEMAIAQREELMAAQAVLTGAYTISGDNIKTAEVDFQRSDANNIILAGADRWSQQNKDTYDPSSDIDTWCDNASGAIDIAVMDGKSWKLLNSFKLFREKLETRRGSKSELETALKDLGKVVSIKGFYGDVAIVVYKGYYIEDDKRVKYMPDNTIVFGNTGYQGSRCYGAIQDAKAISEGITSGTRYPKNWLTEGDPSHEYTMTQSAPLMALEDPDAFVTVKVD